MTIRVPVSWGELIDKITILEIKSERLNDEAKLTNVRRERDVLVAERDANLPGTEHDADHLDKLTVALKTVNEALWEIEDGIRDEERAKRFEDKFIELARAVYINNDQRAALKRQINDLLGSELVEEKSYAAY